MPRRCQTAPASSLLADYYISLQRRDEAQRILEAVAASGVKGATSAKLRLAGMGLGSGDPAAAMKLIDECSRRNRRNWEALLAKAQTLLGLGKVSEAFAAVRSAAETNPQSSETQFALGRMYVLRGQRQEAMAAFTQALKLNPRMAIAEFELAKLHFAANHWTRPNSSPRPRCSRSTATSSASPAAGADPPHAR